ncbi:hypothetical protein [Fontisphaera persica]|uniref:hypothetical protein n=1 Tax=Fontisphaera persica TaxID=2974023 RepID=UPI003CCCD465
MHHTLANHYARVVEMVYAAERMVELLNDPEIVSPEVRVIPTRTPQEGGGGGGAAGTLIHHYRTDERGVITMANLIVATANNAARIAMSVDRAAKSLIQDGKVTEGLLNKVEMAFRAYDPCLGCATHSLPGHLPSKPASTTTSANSSTSPVANRSPTPYANRGPTEFTAVDGESHPCSISK